MQGLLLDPLPPRSNCMTSTPLLGAGPLATAARLYQSLGLSVLPWKYAPDKKGKPAKTPQRYWRVGEHPPMTAEDVTAWWRMNPDHNVGIITGPTRSRELVLPTDMVVLDLDTPEALAWAQANLADTPWKTNTGRGDGAQHWGYRYPLLPEGQIIQTCAGLHGVPGLDVRGMGGYVGMPPSMHKSGREYTWVSGSAPESLSSIPRLDITKVPPVEKQVVDDLDDDDQQPASKVRVQRAQEWLAAQRPAIQGSGGDPHTFRICATLRRGFALDRDQTLEVLRSWNERCVPPWDEGDLIRKIRLGWQEGSEDIGRRGVSPSPDQILSALEDIPQAKAVLPPALDEQEAPASEADPLAEARARAFQIPGDVVVDVGSAFEADSLAAAALLFRKDQPAYHRLLKDLKNCGTKFEVKAWEREVAKTAKTSSVPKVQAINETGDRKRIALTGDEKAVCDAILDVLKDAPTIYARDSALCYIAGGEVQTLKKDRLRNAISQFCSVVKSTYNKEMDSYLDVPVSLPTPIIGMLSELLPEQVAKFRVVEQIVTYPFCSEDEGVYRLVTEEGYDAATRTVLTNCPGVDLTRFSTVQDAVKYLCWLVKDFPFVSNAERDNFISALLTVVVRPAIRGVSPLLILEGNQPDVGKTLLAKLLISLSGECPAVLTPWPDEGVKEATKKILPVLRRSQPVHAWDNVRGHLDSTTLEGTLTAAAISLRTLGVSSDETYANRTLWVLSANNMDANRDTTRRSIRVRLVRTGQGTHEIEDFEAYIYRERSRILSALLRIVEHWIEKGAKELPSLPKLNSFEEWSRTIGSVMHHAGLTEWLTNYKEAQEAMSRGDDWQQFVNAWYDEHKQAPVTAAGLWVICVKTGLLGSVLGDQSDRSQQTRLGKALARQHQAVFGGLQVLLVPQRANSSQYKLCRVGLTAVDDTDSIDSASTSVGATRNKEAA